MIKAKEYKDWSAKLHRDHKDKPIVMQLELTYRCPLRCLHCYSDCYNSPLHTKREMATEDIKKIIDKLYRAKCLWLCYTGGDPMARSDFLELYDYASAKGFILTIFTSLAALNDKIWNKLIERPPFSIEMTLNGVTEKTYDGISQIKGSFKKVAANIDKVLKMRLPLKIKTLLSTNNIHETDKIKRFVESKGLDFKPSTLIFARLNGDTAPCRYRIPLDDVMTPTSPLTSGMSRARDDCGSKANRVSGENRFFRCAAGTWQWHIDPYGNLNICSSVREPSYNLLEGDIAQGVRILSGYVRDKRFTKDSECRTCGLWQSCLSCPGRAALELKDEEAPVPYFCEMAKRQVAKNNTNLTF